MNEPMVTGTSCLDYIQKPIGIFKRSRGGSTGLDVLQPYSYSLTMLGHDNGSDEQNAIMISHGSLINVLLKWKHDINKRVIGYVTGESEDGGYEVILLGNENINFSTSGNNCDVSTTSLGHRCTVKYENVPFTTKWEKPDDIPIYTQFSEDGFLTPYINNPICNVLRNGNSVSDNVSFDDAIDYKLIFIEATRQMALLTDAWTEYQGNIMPPASNYYKLTDDVNNTLKIGKIYPITDAPNLDGEYYVTTEYKNPLSLLSGNLYGYLNSILSQFVAMCPDSFASAVPLQEFLRVVGVNCATVNMCTVPFNLILTRNKQFALEYLSNGTVPPDAFLFPLDWENIPTYNPTDDDEPEDVPNDNKPDDNTRDVIPNPPITPSFIPANLSNYNYYWLTVPQYSDFLNWFWNDIGDYSDFDDIIAKVTGLYNDLASAILMCRFYPVDITRIGGIGTSSNIKVGMIEKQGAVDTISQASPPNAYLLGHIKINSKYKSFLDLAPYSQLSLYLPFHGFIDLDIDIFNNHEVWVYAIYDYLTGTIQYLIYCDNQFLINTCVCKLAVDIPITLQTKNDRDSAVFQNVSSVVGGLIAGGASLMSGNPIGMAIGAKEAVNSVTSATYSAPMNVRGTVGETGALYSPPKCAIILRRPTIQSSDKGSSLNTWKSRVGQLCGYGYTLSNLKGAGLTVCYTPVINFTKTIPLQSEIDEIYDYLQKGVIL